ncbi:hypothetical protein BX666DRAFT_1981155, partial [Dichotomocladium elegans]
MNFNICPIRLFISSSRKYPHIIPLIYFNRLSGTYLAWYKICDRKYLIPISRHSVGLLLPFISCSVSIDFRVTSSSFLLSVPTLSL